MYYKYKSQAKFENDLNNGLIDIKTAIVFIEKPKCIWTHGVYWFCYDESNIITNDQVEAIVVRTLANITNPWGEPIFPGGAGENAALGPNTVTTEHIKNGTIRLEDLDNEVVSGLADDFTDEEVQAIWDDARQYAQSHINQA